MKGIRIRVAGPEERVLLGVEATGWRPGLREAVDVFRFVQADDGEMADGVLELGLFGTGSKTMEEACQTGKILEKQAGSRGLSVPGASVSMPRGNVFLGKRARPAFLFRKKP